MLALFIVATSLWHLAVCISCMAAATSAPAIEFPPAVTLALRSDTVFFGETPELEVVVTAPSDNAIQLVGKRQMYSAEYMYVSMHDTGGRDVPGGLGTPSMVRRKDRSADFARLGPSQTERRTLPLLYRPPKSGEYRIHIVFQCPLDEPHLPSPPRRR